MSRTINYLRLRSCFHVSANLQADTLFNLAIHQRLLLAESGRFTVTQYAQIKCSPGRRPLSGATRPLIGL